MTNNENFLLLNHDNARKLNKSAVTVHRTVRVQLPRWVGFGLTAEFSLFWLYFCTMLLVFIVRLIEAVIRYTYDIFKMAWFNVALLLNSQGFKLWLNCKFFKVHRAFVLLQALDSNTIVGVFFPSRNFFRRILRPKISTANGWMRKFYELKLVFG